MASFPTAGSSGSLQFKVDARVHTAAFTNGATGKARVAHDPAVMFAATVRSLFRAALRERQ